MMTEHKPTMNCSSCHLGRLCLPVGLDSEATKSLEQIIEKRYVLNRGEHLFHLGADFTNLIAVRSGSFKSYTTMSYGEEQIMGFYLPGEILGFDGIKSGKSQLSCVALETSSVCEIPFNKLLSLASRLPEIQRQLLIFMSEKYGPEETIPINSTAEQRVAGFILGLSRRFKRCGYSERQFRLSMSRQDIGNYLGLATETISRILGQLQHKKITSVCRRDITIHDFRYLQKMSCNLE